MKPAKMTAIAFCAAATLAASVAHADSPSSGFVDRSDGWNRATNILAASSIAAELLLPRVFFSDPDVTAGWKARWHVSALAPLMTETSLAFLNEQVLKDAFVAPRPGCDGTSPGQPGCGSYALFSTQPFVAGSALGHGAAVFLVDTLRWSGGQVHIGALLGEVGIPLVLAPITAAGRVAGNWETAGQAWGSAGVGLATGFALGLLYATLQRPECGYTGNLICW